jgi:predicted DNA-binding protein with PD1-like motif
MGKGLSSARCLAFRLSPGADLKREIEQCVGETTYRAAFVTSAVGSLASAVIRFADQRESTTLQGPFELISLSGTVSDGHSHLHLSFAGSTGETLGGHLCYGSLVYTTAEILVTLLPELHFTRAPDPQSGFAELVISGKAD